MQPLRSVFGMIGALVPIVYCGGLVYYFLDLSGSVREAVSTGLGPTVLGLATIGLLFCIPLTVRIVRLLIGSRSSGSGGGPDTPSLGGEDGFDADAVLARYAARQSADESPAPPPASRSSSAPLKHPSFGRRKR